MLARRAAPCRHGLQLGLTSRPVAYGPPFTSWGRERERNTRSGITWSQKPGWTARVCFNIFARRWHSPGRSGINIVYPAAAHHHPSPGERQSTMRLLTSRVGRHAGWRTQGRSRRSMGGEAGFPEMERTSLAFGKSARGSVGACGPERPRRRKQVAAQGIMASVPKTAPTPPLPSPGATAPTPASGHCACFHGDQHHSSPYTVDPGSAPGGTQIELEGRPFTFHAT
jgi:hypothetical protein